MLKKGFKRKYLYIIICVFLVLIAGVAIYLASRVTWGGNYFIFKTSSLQNVIDKVMTTEKSGGTVDLSEADVNALVPTYLKNINKNTMGLKVDGIYAQITGGKISFYVPCSYKGFNLMLFSQGTLYLKGGSIVYNPDVFKIGKLTFAKEYVMQKLGSYKSLSSLITDQHFVIDPNNLPFDITGLSLQNDKLEIIIPKAISQQVPNQKLNRGKTSAGTNSNTTSNEAILRKASSQLGTVYSSVKTSAEKQIIGEMKTVVNKMVQNPSYKYQSEAAAVKSQYNTLSEAEKNDIKDSIFNNMDMSTLRKIKTTFNL